MVTTEADESDVELVVSIPICWKNHQLDNIPLERGRCLCDDMESTSSMDEVVVELGQCPEVCTVSAQYKPGSLIGQVANQTVFCMANFGN